MPPLSLPDRSGRDFANHQVDDLFEGMTSSNSVVRSIRLYKGREVGCFYGAF